MEIVLIMLAVWILGIAIGCVGMQMRSQAFSDSISSCHSCGKNVSISADPIHSRLVMKCMNEDCGATSFRQVRASALSLFGVSRFFLVILGAVLSYLFAAWLDWNFTGRMITALVGLLIGWIVISLLVRLFAYAMLECRPSPIWQEEIVAHLAPPPFWQGQENRNDS